MKINKLLFFILFTLLFLNFSSTYANYKNSNIRCDVIEQYKSFINNDYSYVCSINNNNYIILNWKKIANYPNWYIWDYAISKNKSVAVSFAPLNDTFNKKVYLDNKKIWDYTYYSNLKFSQKDNSLYFVSWDNYSNRLINNWKDITPKNINRIHEFFIKDNWDNYFYWCWENNCNIYKNLKIISSSSTNLVASKNSIWYIKNINLNSSLIINDKTVYNTSYQVWNLYINENWDYYLIETRWDLSYVIKNWKVVSDWYKFINQFIVSNDFNNYYFTSESKENSKNIDLVYNNKIVYSSDSINISEIYFYKDNLYFLKSDNCFYDTLNKTDNDFCWKSPYQIYITPDYKNKILISSDGKLIKTNDRLLDSNWKFTISFLWFSNDSKKIAVLFKNFEKSKINFINLD